MQPTREIEYSVLTGKLPKNWEKPPTPDEIIAAYEAGKSEQAKINQQALSDNLQRACSAAEQLYDAMMNTIGLQCLGLHMRINSLSRFQALFLVDLDGYVTEKGTEAYRKARSIGTSSRTPTFHLEFTLMAVENLVNVNADAIAADGYFLTYLPNGKKTRPRKTQPKSL